MSVYAIINESEPLFFSSNQGWRDVTAWTDGLDETQYAELVQLAEHGISEDIAALQSQIEDAVKTSPPPEDVIATLGELQANLEGESGFVMINDGTGVESETDDEVPVDAA